MTVFNTEQYVTRSINSIINQTLNFMENIQLIIVDDGSDDNSLSIIKKFEKKFPNNILVFSQEHSGQSSARNLGLKYAEGKYVNFLDSDDFIPHHALNLIYDFFEKNYDETDVVVIPMVRFERSTDKDFLNYKFTENQIIDLIKEPNYIQCSVASAFIKSDVAKKYYFEENLHILEDVLYINKILLDKKTLGVFKDTAYYYRLRNNMSDLNSKRYFDENYISQIDLFGSEFINYCSDIENIPIFIQNTLLYLFNKEFENKTFNSLYNYEERTFFEKKLFKLIESVDKEVIMSNNVLDLNLKYHVLFTKNNQNIAVETFNHEIIYKIDDIIVNHPQLFNMDILQIKNVKNYYVFNIKLTFFKNMDLIFSLKLINDIKSNNFEGKIKNKTNINKYSIFEDILYEFKIPSSYISYNSKITFEVKLKNNNVCWIPNIYSKGYLIGENTRIFESSKLIFVVNENKLDIKRKYLFTVVMPIYNVEQYLGTAIDSLVNQTINFEKNIQLIVVDDESPDNSINVALEYQKKYPENIFILHKKNGGQASAFNLGLTQVQGKYVNFLDSDDYLSEDTFELVYDFFEKNYYKIDVVSIPMYLFERRVGPHNLNYKFNKTRIIDLVKEPNNPQLSVSSSVIKYDKIKKMNFDTELSHGYDAVVMNKILFEKKKYGVVKEAKYFYRQRNNHTSMIDNIDSKEDSFTIMLTNFCIELIDYSLQREKKVLPYIQYLIAYDIQWVLRQPYILFDNKIKEKEFWYYLYHVLGYINVNYFLKNRNIDSSLKTLFVFLRNRQQYNIQLEKNELVMRSKKNVLDKLDWHLLWLDNVEIKDNNLNIYGLFSSYFSTDSFVIKVNQKKGDIVTSYVCKNLKYTANHRKDIKFLSMNWNDRYNFDVSIPIKDISYSEFDISVEYGENNIKHSINPEIRFSALCNMSNFGSLIVNNGKILKFEKNKFILKDYNTRTHLKSEYYIIKKLCNEKPEGYLMVIFIRFLHLTLYPILKNKKIWLFADRPTFADDNAFHLFKYSLKQKDGIRKYFVIDKNSADFKKLKKDYNNNIVSFGSLKHKLLYIFAEKNIYAFTKETYWNPFHLNNKLYAGLPSFKRYFLQHGVAVGNFSEMLNKYSNKLSLLNTSSRLEKNSYLEEGYNFDEGTVQLLGLPRYDNLVNDSKKQIVFMPTWRIDIKNEEQLIGSAYYQRIHSFLNNSKLHELLDKYNYDMVFRPHPETMEYIDCFEIDEKIRVSIDVSKESYQTIFKESNLLITDYSSVFFDFSFLKKPIIYYQYADEYNYQEGYFDFDKMGFGLVMDNEEDLLNQIEYYLKNGCEMEQKFKNRVDNFFEYTDRNNCERNYKWIFEH